MLRVRVRNFQSIKKADVVIDGLTVVTGTNNCGKTALMRAIQGVFTNPPASSLVRHGEAFLSVELEFGDGSKVLWEKGWEKADRKGASVNRYVVNGVEIPIAGRGVPPEVAALSVREVPAGSDTLWPQIAQQFDGVLFLVNRPGSATAEALSDVEKVGKLTDALRESEKDRRSAESELKVRRKDLTEAKDRMNQFSGLSECRPVVGQAQSSLAQYEALGKVRATNSALATRLRDASASCAVLMGINPAVPESDRASKLGRSLSTCRSFLGRREESLRSLQRLDLKVVLPSEGKSENAHQDLRMALTLRSRRANAKSKLAILMGLPNDPPTADAAKSLLQEAAWLKAQRAKLRSLTREASQVPNFIIPGPPEIDLATIKVVRSLAWKRDSAKSQLLDLTLQVGNAEVELQRAEDEAKSLLADLEVCPTCQSPVGGPHEPH